MPLNSDQIQQLGELPDPEQEIYMPEKGDNGDHWSEMENVRLIHEGGYWFIQNRGGSEAIQLYEDDGSTTLPTGKYLTFKKHRVYISGNNNSYIVLHKDNGSIYLWDTSSNKYVAEVMSGFSTTNPVQIIPIGKFLYVFDYDFGKAQYYDIEEAATYDFLKYERSKISQTTWGSSAEIDPENNIWGIKEGSEIIFIPGDTKFESQTNLFASGTYSNDKLGNYSTDFVHVFSYYYKGGDYVEVYRDEGDINTDSNWEPIKESGFIYIRPGEWIDVGGGHASGDDPEIYEVAVPYDPQTDEVDFAPRKANVGSIASSGDFFYIDNTNLQYRVTPDYAKYNVLQVNFGSKGVNERRHGFLPNTPDIERLLSNGAKYEANHSNNSIDSTQTDFTVYRSYLVVDVLNDGSVCIPGRPHIEQKSAFWIYDESAGTWNDRIEVSIDAADTPSGVKKRFICATRFQTSPEDTTNPTSGKYPNSPYFILDEVTTESTTYVDMTPDSELIRPLSELYGQALSAGVPNIFGSEQVEPNTVSRFQGINTFGNYKINRPRPYLYSSVKTHPYGNVVRDSYTGVLWDDKEIGVQFRYDDGTYSQLVKTWEADGSTADLADDENRIVIHSLNAMVRTIEIIVYDSSIDEYYRARTIAIDSPYANGAEFVVYGSSNAIDDMEVINDPTQRDIKETIYAESWFLVSPYQQQLDIGKQRRIADQSSIEYILPLKYAGDKSTLRFQLLAFTDNNIQLGYYTEKEGNAYSDFEVISEHAVLRNKFSVYRTRIGENVLFQSKDGISLFSPQKGVRLVIDLRKYNELNDRDVTGIWYWGRWNEYWIAFGDQRVLVFNMEDQYTRSMRYPTLIHTGIDLEDTHYISKEPEAAPSESLIKTDLDSTQQDYGIDVEGKLISQPIGNDHNEIRLWDAIIYGSNGTATLEIDLNPASQRGNTSTWTPEFNPTITYNGLGLDMKGVRKMIQRVATKPQIAVKVVENDYFYISSMKLRYIPLKNLR